MRVVTASSKCVAIYPTKASAQALFVTLFEAFSILSQLQRGLQGGDGRIFFELDQHAWKLTVYLDDGDAQALVDELEHALAKFRRPTKPKLSKIERAAEKARPFIRSLRPGAPDVGDDVPLPIRITDRAKLARKLGGAR